MALSNEVVEAYKEVFEILDIDEGASRLDGVPSVVVPIVGRTLTAPRSFIAVECPICISL